MNRAALAALGVAVGVAVWLASRRKDGADGVSDQITNAFGEGLDYMGTAVGSLGDSFGFVRVSNMGSVDRSLVNHPNVRAMFRVIRQGESSQDDSIAYRMIVGGKLFNSFADHPRVAGKCWNDPKTGQRLCSSAAGAYQIVKTTWDEVRVKMGLRDFSPASQDMAALGRIAYRGALPAVLAGDVSTAVRKLRNEWTSLPGASENNSQAGNIENARRMFVAFGGSAGPVYG